MSGGRRSAPPGVISRYPSQPLVSRGPSEKTTVGKTPEEMKDHLQSQLSAVEKLQYQLTAHELQFAQRMVQKEQQAAEQIKVTVVSSSSDSNEGERNHYNVTSKLFSVVMSIFTLHKFKTAR